MENTHEIFDKMPEFSRIGSFSFLMWAILIGLFLALVVNMGPAFITLVQTSLHRGFRSAAWFATGVILNDAMVVAICILTSVQVVMQTGFEAALACIGAGVILLLFGIFTYRKKVEQRKERDEYIEKRTNEVLKNQETKPSWFVFFGKGFVLNILNPFVWLFWFSSVAIVAGNMGGPEVPAKVQKLSTVVFFAIILGTTYAIELLKAWGAAKLKRFLTPERTTLINRIAGVLLMLSGAYFIVFRGIVNIM